MSRLSRCAGDEVEDLLGKGHDQTSRQSQEPLGALGWIMALKGKPYLYHAPTQQDEADGAD